MVTIAISNLQALGYRALGDHLNVEPAGPGEDDLTFSPGDVFALLHRDADNTEWWFAQPQNDPAKQGFIPANYFRCARVLPACVPWFWWGYTVARPHA